MRLFLVELTRFRARRAIAMMVLAATLLAAFVVLATAYGTRSVDPTEVAAAQEQMDRDRELNEGEYQLCLSDPEGYLGPGASADDCALTEPQLDWYISRPTLDIGNVAEGQGIAVMVLISGIAVLIGTSFAGADWSSGSLSNQLIFEPRRGLVWATKALAVTLGTAVATALVLTGFWAALQTVAASRDITTPDAAWDTVMTTSGRAVVLAAASALGAFSLTMLLRNTVGTLGLLFAYAVAGEGLAAALPFEKMQQWSLAVNVIAWLQDGVDIFDENLCQGPDAGPGCVPYFNVSLEHAALYMGALLAFAMVVSVLSFRRRDVP